MKNAIRVLVIEDNRLAREALVALLEAQPDCEVVAAAEGVDVGLLRVQETKPHVVLVNASLVNRGGQRLVEALRRTAPEVRVIVMDLLPVEENVVAFVKAGVAGFVGKRATIDDIVATARAVAGDAKVVPPPFTAALFSYIANESAARGRRAASGSARMSQRELEIMQLIAEGLSNKDIARRLGIVPDTVKSHVRRILERLGLHNRIQIAVYVHRIGHSS